MLRIVRLRSTIKQFCNGYLGDKTTLLSNLIDFFKHFMIVFALSGAVCATEKGKFSAHPVKGNQGVYVFQVTDRRKLEGAFDVKSYENKAAQGYMSMFSRMVFNELVNNAHVTDNRYLFF